MKKVKDIFIPSVVWVLLTSIALIASGIGGWFLGIFIGIKFIGDAETMLSLGCLMAFGGLILSTALKFWLEDRFAEYIDVE